MEAEGGAVEGVKLAWSGWWGVKAEGVEVEGVKVEGAKVEGM